MRAEDVKEGMWVRTVSGHPVKIGAFSDTGPTGPAWKSTWLGYGDGWIEPRGAAHVEPWVPRVGERVCAPSIGPGHGVVYFVADGGVVTEGGYMVPFDKIEPCAPPEAKPETRAGRFVREATPEQIVAAVINDKIPPEAEWRAGWDKAHDHNAKCSRCGGRAYQGIGLGYCEDCGIDCGVRDRDDDAAIETLRAMLLEHAAGQASAVRETRVDPRSSSEDTTDMEHVACIAIALALLL